MMRVVISLIYVFALTGVSALKDDSPRLTYQGLGDIRIGMDEQALAQFGFAPYPEDEAYKDEQYLGCHYIASDRYPGVALMINYGSLVRIDINEGSWQSFSGAGIGMNEAQVAELYAGKITLKYHPYAGKYGSNLILRSSNKKYGMIFETSVTDSQYASPPKHGPNPNKKVTRFRVGLAGPVDYIEGCS